MPSIIAIFNWILLFKCFHSTLTVNYSTVFNCRATPVNLPDLFQTSDRTPQRLPGNVCLNHELISTDRTLFCYILHMITFVRSRNGNLCRLRVLCLSWLFYHPVKYIFLRMFLIYLNNVVEIYWSSGHCMRPPPSDTFHVYSIDLIKSLATSFLITMGYINIDLNFDVYTEQCRAIARVVEPFLASVFLDFTWRQYMIGSTLIILQ